MATRSTNVESDESTISQIALVSCNRRLVAPAIARTPLNTHLRSEDFVRIVLRGGIRVKLRPEFEYGFPGFQCSDNAVKNRKMLETKGASFRELSAA